MLIKLGFARLRNAELIRYISQLLTFIDEAGAAQPQPLQDAVAALRKRLDELNVLHKADPEVRRTEEMMRAEDERDELVHGLYGYCESFTHLAANPALQEAGMLLLDTIEVYGTASNIANRPHATETTEIESLLADFKKPAQAAAATLLRAELFTIPLEETNKRFDRLFLDRTEQKAQQQETAAMRTKRSETAAAYDLLLRKLSGAYEMQGVDAWGSLVAKANALAEEYRRTIAQRIGRTKGAKDESEAPAGTAS